ncbi:MAG: ABC transporter permease [Caldilinea sp.]|nr:ABC transporter permease [Caldilineaceae bacterium]MCW5841549.1 ABC transporter permease [Caldilinea sp.]MCB9113477.1 ABC transporter permease [Caldilineaceae bacterium]MCB9118956.1 ABC transporter permease [Caldilineaceae bacterium]MCB9125668.1 ABC transporter permease [Caldilineaceae bacterium]
MIPVWNRLSSLIRKEFIQIIRDPRTLAMTFIMPIVMMFLLGYAATNDVRNIALVVLDQDQTPASRRLIDAYRVADYFTIAQPVGSEDELRDLIDRNVARAGLIIPPGYGRDLAGWQSAEVAFILDGSDPTVASTALAAAQLIGQSLSTQTSIERMEARGQTVITQQPIDVRTIVWFNPGLISSYYMVPAMIGIILQYLTTMLTATSIVRERERGTIEQLIVTPLRSWELILGKLIPYVLIAFLNTIEVLTIGVVLFHVPINGDLLLLLTLTALFLVTTLGIGLLISSIANTQQEAMLTTMFTLLPSIFLSGFFFPLAAMPIWLQIVSYAIPLRYFLIIVRGIVLKGVGLSAIWPEVVALAIFAFVVMSAAVRRFRKSLD